MRAGLARGGTVAVTNNFYSADLTAWSPAEAVARVGPFERDNVLPRLLRDEAGCEVTVLPRSVRTALDLDTPAELAVLALSEATPPALREALPPEESLPLAPYRALMPLLCDADAEILLAGRVGSATWAHLERETACRVRLVKRGARAGRRAGGARSPVARGEAAGRARNRALRPRSWRRWRTGWCWIRACCWPTRGRARAVRTASRATCSAPGRVADPWLRDLTAALAGTEVPALPGGHSLLSGGLMALADQAWRENDRKLGIDSPGR